jgi:hypothetical protein
MGGNSKMSPFLVRNGAIPRIEDAGNNSAVSMVL